jgi:hypothetical protein
MKTLPVLIVLAAVALIHPPSDAQGERRQVMQCRKKLEGPRVNRSGRAHLASTLGPTLEALVSPYLMRTIL